MSAGQLQKQQELLDRLPETEAAERVKLLIEIAHSSGS